MQIKINGWQLSTLVLGSLFAGSLCSQGVLSSIANAAPADVKGSPDVAVTGFQTKGGTYTLWSDGHITDVPQNGGTPKTVNAPDAYKSGKDLPNKANPTGGKSKGSPHVAVGILPTKSVTYVLFADGSARVPTDTGASKGSGSAARVESGVYYARIGGQEAKSTTSGVSITLNLTAQPNWGPNYSTTSGFSLKFDPPFETVPIVNVQSLFVQPVGTTGYTFPYSIPIAGMPQPPGSQGQSTQQSGQLDGSLLISSPTKDGVNISAGQLVVDRQGNIGAGFSFVFTAIEPDSNDQMGSNGSWKL